MGRESGVAATCPAHTVRDGTDCPADTTTAHTYSAAHANAPPDAETDTDSDTPTDANSISYAFTDSATNGSTNAGADTGPDHPSGANGTTHQRPNVATHRYCSWDAGRWLSSGGGDCAY
ncbi:MAG TPA: hypothetical protein VG413_00195, partial [Candidatus Dormibacteraeota bacterium]|nr:hypothetical protein [Candidatus Dormibacteraeota bacterium]